MGLQAGTMDDFDQQDVGTLQRMFNQHNRTPYDVYPAVCYDRGSLGKGFYHDGDIVLRLKAPAHQQRKEFVLYGDGRIFEEGKTGRAMYVEDVVSQAPRRSGLPAVSAELIRLADTESFIRDIMES